MADLSERLQRLEDRVALSELRARYCWYTERAMKGELLNLFVEDGVFENHRSTRGKAGGRCRA